MTVTLTYDASIARVRVSADDTFTAEYITIQRSINGQQWTTVRGASAIEPSPAAEIDDYEFTPGVVNTYRARSFSALDVLLGTETNTITPTIDHVWLKSVTRPFLNMPVTVIDYTPISRRSRAGMFEVIGRSFPVRVSDVASSRSWSLDVLTRTLTESRALEFLAASGDTVHVQVPSGFDIPGGYVGFGDMTIARVSRPLTDDKRRITLPMTEIAAPGPEVVGATTTWAALVASFGTWADVLAAFPTWADVLEYVADPEIVIVP
jgi:hypothetical protein